MTIPVRQLKNGFAMPLLGMGSWMLGGGAERDPASDGEKEAAALRSGLELGFRHIDTAEMYAGGFSEEIVGRAIRGWKRSDLFLTSKVWKTHLAYDEVLRACERSLRRLGTDYLDLYLIHQVDDAYPLEETIRALDRLADEKLVRHIGVSNFAVARLERARACAGHPIAANQVHYNLAVREAELSGLTDYCVEHDIMLIAWRPLQKGMLDAEAPELLREIARRHGLQGMKIACVTGDDLLPVINKYMDAEVWETHEPLSKLPGEIVSANAYMGVEGILKALEQGADVVITGRVADPAIFMAPAIHAFGWSLEDWDKLGKGTMMGHLLECGGQVTGGYFAEPGKKDVPGLGHLGFPIVEISEDGSFFVTKIPESGGMVTVETCSEQIVYEIHDPENYLTPDVVADFKQVKFTEVEKDKVKVEGASGKPRTETFKCSIGYKDCFIGDGEISYGGPGCVARGRLALDIIKERLELVAPGVFDELKFDLIGCNSLYWNPDFKYNEEPSEVRVRVSGRAKARADAELIGNEVEALYTNGPAGGCGAVKRTRDIVSVASILVSRCDVKPEVEIFEV